MKAVIDFITVKISPQDVKTGYKAINHKSNVPVKSNPPGQPHGHLKVWKIFG